MWNGNIQDTILFEDHDLLVCRKPAGTAVQSARIGTPDMESLLRNYLAGHAPGKAPYLGVVHRLDQPVEGILVFAKTPEAAGALSRQMASKEWKKEYLAVTDHAPSVKSGELIDYLKKNGKTNLSEIVPEKTSGAKKARLTYSLWEELSDQRTGTGQCFLLYIVLDTGRHHQIRVQMAHAGMPLVGDRKYYPQDPSGLPLALCAWRLTFRHPVTGKKLKFSLKPQGAAFEGFSLTE